MKTMKKNEFGKKERTTKYPAIQKDFYRKKFEIRQKSLLHEDVKKNLTC